MLDRITEALQSLGFVFVTIDTQGYRSGSMNDVLPVSAIASAHDRPTIGSTKQPELARETS
jgi:hypothetical protein